MIIINKVILMGRLTRDPEVRYSQSANPIAVARYGLAVRRQYKQEGQPDVDFINIVAFGKAGEFAEKYFSKGQMISVVGRLQLGTWEDKEGIKRTNIDVIVEEQHFAESKASFEGRGNDRPLAPQSNPGYPDGFTPVGATYEDEEDLPF